MRAEDCRAYLNKSVGIGLPHWVVPDKLFFYYGTIIEITDNFLLLKGKNGLKQIILQDINQIVKDRDGMGNDY